MRISTLNVDEFLESLQDVKTIFENTIRVSVNKRSTDSDNARDTVRPDVWIQASCIVSIESGEYLLEVGEFCGHDYNDASQDKLGTKQALLLKGKIKELADSKGWRILPGLISE